MKMTINELLKEIYEINYPHLGPSSESKGLVKDLWGEWEKTGKIRPDIDNIAKYNSIIEYERAYFQEIVSIAFDITNISKNTLRIEQAPFILNSYNLCASRALDGYLVIVDETFFKMLFSLTNILMYSAYNFIEDVEEENFKSLTKRLLNEYIEQKFFTPFDSKGTPEIRYLLGKDYDTAEVAIYLFNSFKTFMLAHEIGHCLLKHADSTIEKSFRGETKEVTIDIDKRSYECEFEADIFGYNLFKRVMDTTDDSIDKAYLKYRFDFAPLFLFDIFEQIDKLIKKNNYSQTDSITHPSPQKRKNNLIHHFQLKEDDLLYSNLRSVLNDLIK